MESVQGNGKMDVLIRRNRLFYQRDGFCQIEYKEALDFLLPRHYSGRSPTISYAFGAYESGVLMAVCTYGKPGSPEACYVCGRENSLLVYELNRLCRVESYTKPLSEFVAWTLRFLSKFNLIIISYSDTGLNHHGYIYQACNFLYLGMTKERTDAVRELGKHSRHLMSVKDGEREVKNLVRVWRTKKHRYVYFACNKRLKKSLRKKLVFREEAYPKGDNDCDYELGWVYKQTIVQREV